MKIKTKISPEMFIIIYFIFQPIYLLLKLQFGTIIHFVFPIFYLIIIALNWKFYKNKKFYVFVMIFFALSAVRAIYSYQNCLYNYFGLMYLLFFTTLPWLLIACNITQPSLLLQNFKKNSKYIFIADFIFIIYCIITKRNMLGNMEISYAILPLLIFYLYLFFKERNLKSLMLSFMLFVLLIVVGSRGPLLCIAAFIIMYLLSNMRKNKILTLLITVLILFVSFHFDSILQYSIEILNENNLNSRTLIKIRNGDISNDTGRSYIYDVVKNELEENPILGIGLGVDRIVINNKIYSMTKDMSSCYPHNVILEILVQYGYFIGGATLLVISYLILKAFFISDTDGRNIIIYFFATEIVRLFISSSYIVSPITFMLIGICYSIIKEKKKNEENGIDCTK